MDLRALEEWTRDRLEAEAKRRGFRDCEFRSRRALAQLIFRDQYGDQLDQGRAVLQTARGLIGAAVDTARDSLLPARRSTPPPAPESSSVQPPADEEPPRQVARPRARRKANPEPITTRSMARVLANQGLVTRALSIYDHLLALRGNDGALRGEADALREADDKAAKLDLPKPPKPD